MIEKKKIPELFNQIEENKETLEKLKTEDESLIQIYELQQKEHDSVIKDNNELKTILNRFIELIENNSKCNLSKIKKKILQYNLNEATADSNTNDSEAKIDDSDKPFQIESCCICKKNSDLHLIIDCDKCKNYYHINCLDPPLDSVPKKTKQYGWECSKCTHDDTESENEEIVDLNAPRSLRNDRKREEKKAFNLSTYLNKSYQFDYVTNASKADDASSCNNNNSNKNAKKSKKQNKRKNKKRSNSESIINSKKKIKLNDTQASNNDTPIINQCKLCNQNIDKKDSLKCSKCSDYYHGKCLNPPVNSKQYKGYAWICENCDDENNVENDMNDDDVNKEANTGDDANDNTTNNNNN